MRTFIIKPGDLIPIGRAGENQATEIRFDVTGWAETFGAGQYALVMKRPGESELPYPIEVTTDGDYVVWVVSNVDTGIVGNAQVQLRYTVDGALAKSVIYRGIVGESLDHAVDPPDPYDDLIERIEELARQTEQNAESASRSAGNASNSADAAGRSAGNASDSADAAGRSANNAAQSVTDANAAKLAAQAAQQHAEAAQAGAEAAEARIMDTVPDAVTNWLNLHVDPATGYVIDDSLTIQNAAADAKAVGDALIDKAGVITDTASGAIASFPDGTDAPIKQLTVNIQPQQNLHGYDNPWPAGGGKNLLPTSVVGLKSGNAAGTWSGNEYTYNGVKYTINTDQDGNVTGINANGTASADSDIYLVQGYTFPAGSYTLNGCPSGGSSSTYRIFATNWGGDTGSGATVTLDGSTSTNMRIQIKNGTTANNLLFKPMVRLSSVTDGTFAPYSNVCPITGWTGAVVTRTGKNILNLDESEMTSTGWNRFFPFTIKAGSYTISCQNTIEVGSKKGVRISLCDSSSIALQYITVGYYFGESTLSYSFVVTEEIASKTVSLRFEPRASGLTFADIEDANIQLQLGSTASDFEAYQGTSYPITWQSEAGTVYGGTLTVEQDGTGTLSVEFAERLENGEGTWYKGSTANLYYRTQNRSTFPYKFKSSCRAISDKYKFKGTVASGYASFIKNGEFCLYYSSASAYAREVVYRNESITSVEDWKAELAQNPIHLVYELDTPVTYTLTAPQMKTLLGQNNWWADCGDVSVTYRADTRKFIEKKLAALVAALS